MKSGLSYLVAALVATLCLAFSDASAADRKHYSLTKSTFKAINKVERAYAKQDYAKAEELLQKALKRKGTTPYGKYFMWSWMASLHHDNLEQRIVALEEALAASQKILPEQFEIDMLSSLSRAHFRSGDYKQATWPISLRSTT